MTVPVNLGAYREGYIEGVARGQEECVRDLYGAIYGNDSWPDRPLDTIWEHLLEQVRKGPTGFAVEIARAVKLPTDTDPAVLLAEVRSRFKGTVRAVVGHAYMNGYNACECGESFANLDRWTRHVEDLREAGAKDAHLDPEPQKEDS